MNKTTHVNISIEHNKIVMINEKIVYDGIKWENRTILNDTAFKMWFQIVRNYFSQLRKNYDK